MIVAQVTLLMTENLRIVLCPVLQLPLYAFTHRGSPTSSFYAEQERKFFADYRLIVFISLPVLLGGMLLHPAHRSKQVDLMKVRSGYHVCLLVLVIRDIYNFFSWREISADQTLK